MHPGILGILLILLCSLVPVDSRLPAPAPPSTGFARGEDIHIECRDWETGAWGQGPICHETGRAFVVNMGLDSLKYCGLEIANETVYKSLVALIKLEKTWHCRVPVSAERDAHVPFTIPLWGTVAEGSHVQINNRLHFIFHTRAGRIIGAAAYPVREHFLHGKVGSMITTHAMVRWFHHQSFHSASGAEAMTGGAMAGERSEWVVGGVCALVSSLATLLAAAVVYQGRLKPAIIRNCLKRD